MAKRKIQEVGTAEALLTTTAQMIGSALGKIAVKTGIESPPKASPAKRKKGAAKKISATRKKAASKKTSSKSARKAKKR